MNHDANHWSEIWKTTSNAHWKEKSKVKIKESKLLYKRKWTVMIVRFDSQQRYGNKY